MLYQLTRTGYGVTVPLHLTRRGPFAYSGLSLIRGRLTRHTCNAKWKHRCHVIIWSVRSMSQLLDQEVMNRKGARAGGGKGRNVARVLASAP